MSWDCRRCGRLCRPLEPACPACTWSRPPGPCRDKTLIFKYPLPKADAHKARETKRLYKGHFKTPYCLKIVGRMMYTGSWDRTAASWDLESETMVRLYQGHSDAIYCLDVAESAHRSGAQLGGPGTKETRSDVLYTGSADRTVRAWVASTGRLLAEFVGHASTVWCVQVQGDRLYTGSYDCTARVWDVATGAALRVFTGHCSAIANIAVLGSLLFTSGGEYTRTAYEREHFKLFVREPPPPPDYNAGGGGGGGDGDGGGGGDGGGRAAAVVAHRMQSWHGGEEHTVRVWDLQAAGTDDALVCSFRGHTGTVMAMRAVVGLSRYGTALAFTGSEDATARSWDVASGRCLQRFVGHTKAVSCLEVVGERLYTGSWDCSAMVWQIDTTADPGGGASLASGGGGSMDGAHTAPLRRLQGHSKLVRCLSVQGSAAHPILLTGSYDASVRMWDVNAIRDPLVATYVGHRDVIWSMTVHGGVLFTASADLELMGVSIIAPLMLHSRAPVRECGVELALAAADDALRHECLCLAFDETALRALLVMLCAPDAPRGEVRARYLLPYALP